MFNPIGRLFDAVINLIGSVLGPLNPLRTTDGDDNPPLEVAKIAVQLALAHQIEDDPGRFGLSETELAKRTGLKPEVAHLAIEQLIQEKQAARLRVVKNNRRVIRLTRAGRQAIIDQSHS